MTRDEDKARTRAALIDAAAAEFGQHGFARARVERIAARAGVTTGALYAHFRSKEDLFVAVIDFSAAYTIKDMADIVGIAFAEPAPDTGTGTEAGPSTGAASLDPTRTDLPEISSVARRPLPRSGRTGLVGVADAWFGRHTSDVGWFRLSVDFSLITIDNPRLHAPLQASRRVYRQWLATLFEAVAAHRGRRFRTPAARLAQTAHALGYGMVLEWISDPDSVPPNLFGDLLEELFLAATEQIPAGPPADPPSHPTDSEEIP